MNVEGAAAVLMVPDIFCPASSLGDLVIDLIISQLSGPTMYQSISFENPNLNRLCDAI